MVLIVKPPCGHSVFFNGDFGGPESSGVPVGIIFVGILVPLEQIHGTHCGNTINLVLEKKAAKNFRETVGMIDLGRG